MVNFTHWIKLESLNRKMKVVKIPHTFEHSLTISLNLSSSPVGEDILQDAAADVMKVKGLISWPGVLCCFVVSQFGFLTLFYESKIIRSKGSVNMPVSTTPVSIFSFRCTSSNASPL